MVAIDLAIFAAASVAVLVVVIRWRALTSHGARPVALLLLVALGCIAALHASSFVLPRDLAGLEPAAAEMARRHLGYGWYLDAAAVAALFAGLLLVVIRQGRQDGTRDGAAGLGPILEALPGLVLLSDTRLRCLLINRRGAGWFDTAPESAAGRHVSEILGERIYQELAPFLDRALAGETLSIATTVDRPGGARLPVSVVTAAQRGADGGVAGCLLLASDESASWQARQALEESEERLRQIEALANVGYYVWDAVGDRCLYCSEEHAALHGMTVEQYKQRASGTEGALSRTHPDDRDAYREATRRLRQGGRLELEYRIVRPDGTVRWLREVANPVFDETGAVVRERGVVQDITESKRLEASLLRAQKMQAIGQLTGGVAHDFNNLLGVIVGNLELALDAPGEPDQRDRLATALKAAERGAALVRHLLAFARRQPLSPEPVHVGRLIQGMMDLLRRTLGATIDLEFVQDASLWRCLVDPAQLESGILNLVINARDAMSGGGHLTIEASNARLDDEYSAAQEDVEPGQYVLIAITDTGTGMPREVMEQVFEPFFTTKEMASGSGLGLSMVYGFVKQSGGHIKVYSEVGEGTTVKVYLPRHYGEEAAAQPPRLGEEPAGSDSELILVVEDDPDLRSLCSSMLRSLGYRVIAAAEARGAIGLIEAHDDIALLVTDVILPGGTSGRTLADRVRAIREGLPVLFMSGYSENAILHKGRLEPGVELLQKPFRKSDLARAVKRALLAGPTP